MIIVRALFVRRGLELVLIVVCSFLTTTCSTTGRQIANTSPAGIDDKPLRLVRAYIVSVNVPCDAATMVMKSITDSVPLKYGNYDQVAFRSAIGIEQFRPLQGSRAGAQSGLTEVVEERVVQVVAVLMSQAQQGSEQSNPI